MSSSGVPEGGCAIRAQALGKHYQIYESPRDRLKQFVVPRLQRLAGLPPRRYYREFWALQDVSFEIRPGETVGIVGRNGSGKSTLLQIVSGTLHPSCGSVDVNGRVAALLELGSGFNPEFTGRENVYMSGAVLGLSRAEVDERFEAIRAFADIGDFIEQPVKTYSSGMYVRLAFAVIAHADADILVIDEALSVGDAYFVQKCMRFLRGFMERGTLLFCSHDSGAVNNLCDRALLLRNGRLEMAGTPKEVTEHYLADLHGAAPERGRPEPVRPPSRPAAGAPAAPAQAAGGELEIFRFGPDNSGFGAGGARIVEVRFFDLQGAPQAFVTGGEDVVLEIRCEAVEDLLHPIVGFQFKDRLGQVLFAENTLAACRAEDIPVAAGGSFAARFAFRLPLLPVGDYSVTAAVADGTEASHVQQHWIHDALIVRAHASRVSYGLVGLPMSEIAIQRISCDAQE